MWFDCASMVVLRSVGVGRTNYNAARVLISNVCRLLILLLEDKTVQMRRVFVFGAILHLEEAATSGIICQVVVV